MSMFGIHKIVLALGLLIGLSGAASAQYLFPIQQSQISGGGNQPVSGCPAGHTCQLSFDDEFTQDASLNPNFWNPSCDTAHMTFDATNGLSIYGHSNILNACGSYIERVNGNPLGLGAGISQKFGIWEWQFEEPTDTSGEGDGYHTDFFFRARVSPGGTTTGFEFDTCETQLSTSQNQCFGGVFDTNTTNPDYGFTLTGIHSGWHTVDMVWTNDGSANGAVQVFLDGSATASPYDLQNSDWSNGLDAGKFGVDSGGLGNIGFPNGTAVDGSTSNNNPLRVKYARVWTIQ